MFVAGVQGAAIVGDGAIGVAGPGSAVGVTSGLVGFWAVVLASTGSGDVGCGAAVLVGSQAAVGSIGVAEARRFWRK